MIGRVILLAAVAAGAAWGQSLTVPCGSLPQLVGTSVNVTCSASGGTAPYTWSISAGALPPGLTQNPSTGAITGTLADPAGNDSFTVTATDSTSPTPLTGSQSYSGTTVDPLTVSCVPPPPSGCPVEAGVPYSAVCTASGGTAPYSWGIGGSAKPPGIAITPTGNPATVSVTPASPLASYQYRIDLQDSTTPTPQKASTAAYTGAIVPAVTITTTSPLPMATIGTAYSQTFAAVGGVGGYTWQATGAPAWLTLSSAGVLSGVPPATATTASFTVKVTDSANASASGSFTVPVTLTIITTSPLPPATVTQPYSQTLTAGGGTGGYLWSATGLPGWLTLSTAGALSGTPTAPAALNLSATVKDSSGAMQTASFALQVNITPLIITTTSPLPNGAIGAAYSQTLAGSGGVPPYTWSVTSGPLPNNLSLNAGTGAISGTPTTAGTFNFTVQLSDSASTTPVSAQFAITIASGLTITTAPTLPNATVGTLYSQTLAAAGGTPLYSWTITQGTLPAPLTLNPETGVISGTPAATSTGPFNFTVQVSDSTKPVPITATKAFTLTVLGKLVITTTSLPNGILGVAYNQTLAASGGSGTYTWTIISGSPPTGTSLGSSNGTLSGTPTSSGTFQFTVQVTDTASNTATQAYTVTVASAPVITTPPELPVGSVGTPYSETLSATGGTPPYKWTVASGTLPAGLSLSTGGVINGTPTAAGNSGFMIAVTDGAGATTSKSFTLDIAGGLTISTVSLPGATTGTPYSFQLQATGGSAPYFWVLTFGTLPNGLSLSSNGLISGTPTVTGTSAFAVQVTDSASHKASKEFALGVGTALSITTATLPNGSLGVAYSQTLTATGGVPPYIWLVVSGTLPPGLTLSSSGAITGLPTASGQYSFGVQVTDSARTTASKQFQINVVSGLTITTATPLPEGLVGASYLQTLTAAGGAAPYSWAITSGALPPGLTLAGASISGKPTTAGTYTFTVQVTDNVLATATQSLSLTITSGLIIKTRTGTAWRSCQHSLFAATGGQWRKAAVQLGSDQRGAAARTDT